MNQSIRYYLYSFNPPVGDCLEITYILYFSVVKCSYDNFMNFTVFIFFRTLMPHLSHTYAIPSSFKSQTFLTCEMHPLRTI